MGMQLIETVELASAASSIEFTSIPQDGVDLVLVLSARNADGFSIVTSNYFIDLNNAGTGTKKILWGTGNSTQSVNYTELNGMDASGSTANTFSSHSFYFQNYTSSANKSFSIDSVSENNATDAYQLIAAGLWANTAAITSVKVRPEYGTLVQHSTASLYKITAD